MSLFLYARATCVHIVLILVQVRFHTFLKRCYASLWYIPCAIIVTLVKYNMKAFALHVSGVCK